MRELKIECHRLVNIIVASGAISKKDLFCALAIRLRIPIGECYIRDFDEKTLRKAIKELKYMIDLNL